MALIPLFVFGTLRVGFGNHGMFGEACHSAYTGVEAPGRMYYAGYSYAGEVRSAGYPCVRFDEPGTVIGDLLFVDEEHPNTSMVHRMELGAGYVMAEVPVTLEDGRIIMATAYHWPEGAATGRHIESGNYETDRMVRR